MKKNVAGQEIGIQMVDAADGSAFTGSVVCYVTGQGAAQAVGSVGSGACTHKGNGYHVYAPAQAETNYDHVSFTFVGSGAVPASVQVFPNFPQTGDSFARIGAPAGASVSADIAAVKVDTAAILDDTGTTGVPVVGASVRMAVGLASANLDTQLNALPTADENAAANPALSAAGTRAAVGLASANLDTQLSALAVLIEAVPTAGENAAANPSLSAAGVRAAVGLASANLDTQIQVVKDDTAAILEDTGNSGVVVVAASKNGYRLSATGVDDILDEVIEGAVTLRQSQRLHNAALGGRASGLEGASATYRDLGNSKDRVVATVDDDGNRTAVVLDLT